MTGSQRGAVIGGTWLIGLGLVFLAQQALDVPWGQAWPLFLVLAGVGTGVSALVGMAGRARPLAIAWALVWPLILIVAGVLLFLDFADLAPVDAWGLLLQWWPVILIALGALVLLGAMWPSARGVEEGLSVPLDAAQGEVRLRFGAGELEVGRGTPGRLVEGTFEGGVIRRDVGPGSVELSADAAGLWPWVDRRLRWRMGLAPDVPLTLRVEGGAYRGFLDLSGLAVQTLTLKTGASDTRIVLPRDVARCEVRIEAGAAQVGVDVPPDVAARIHSTMALGTTRVDEARFPRAADGWASSDLAGAARVAEIWINGGVGTVRIS
jgi:hypothetical protein